MQVRAALKASSKLRLFPGEKAIRNRHSLTQVDSIPCFWADVAQSSIAKAKALTVMIRIAAEEANCEVVKPLLSNFGTQLSADIAMSCVHAFHSFVPSVSN